MKTNMRPIDNGDFPPNYGKPLVMVSRQPICACFRLSPIGLMLAVAGGLLLAALGKWIVGG